MSYKEDFYKQCMVLDTETNSDDYNIAEIIESGFVIRDEGVWSMYQDLHRPVNTPIPPKVQSICYITNSMVEKSPPFVEVKDVFQNVVDVYQSGYFVGHNSFFDQRVLENHGIDFGAAQWICTWRMAKKLFADEETIEETNLPYLRFALELDIPIDVYCHRAGNDSLITAKLLETFVELLESSGIIDTNMPYGPQIYQWTNEPIIYTRMPFGKYKGMPMESIPVDYWKWAIKNTHWFDDTADNYDPDLAASIHRVLVTDDH